MKQYPKLYEDIYKQSRRDASTDKITSTFGSPEILGVKFRDFYKDAHVQMFDMIVKQVWLEQQFVYGEQRREKRVANGFMPDWAFAEFMKVHVGISQKPITLHPMFSSVSTYLKDFFPEFLKHDPFANPEYFKYPFENVTLDHLNFVYQVDGMRMEMLQYADDNKMSYMDFSNWATNHILSYNDEIGEDIYKITMNVNAWPHIRNTSLKRGWSNDKFKFE